MRTKAKESGDLIQFLTVFPLGPGCFVLLFTSQMSLIPHVAKVMRIYGKSPLFSCNLYSFGLEILS